MSSTPHHQQLIYPQQSTGTSATIAGSTITYPSTNIFTTNVGTYSNGTIGASSYHPTSYIFTATNNGKEIVRLNLDGTVVWADGIDVDAAAEAFAQSLTIGSEIRAGITERVKLKIRDSVFNDIINIAKEHGALSAEDLKMILDASRIVERLKDIK